MIKKLRRQEMLNVFAHADKICLKRLRQKDHKFKAGLGQICWGWRFNSVVEHLLKLSKHISLDLGLRFGVWGGGRSGRKHSTQMK